MWYNCWPDPDGRWIDRNFNKKFAEFATFSQGWSAGGSTAPRCQRLAAGWWKLAQGKADKEKPRANRAGRAHCWAPGTQAGPHALLALSSSGKLAVLQISSEEAASGGDPTSYVAEGM